MVLQIKSFLFSLVFNILMFHIDFRISGVVREVGTVGAWEYITVDNDCKD